MRTIWFISAILACALVNAVAPYPSECITSGFVCSNGMECVLSDSGSTCLPANRELKMFVSQQAPSAAEIGSIQNGNTLCQIESEGAVGAVPGEVYFAFMGNSSVHPRNSFFVGGSRYVNKMGEVVFANVRDIFANKPMLHALTQYEDTSPQSAQHAPPPQPVNFWTGVNSLGEPYHPIGGEGADFDCSNWKSTKMVQEGAMGLNSVAAGSAWATAMTHECSAPAHVMCVQQDVVSTACMANPCNAATHVCVPRLETDSYECVLKAPKTCTPTTCANGGTCVDFVNHPKCFCADGFAGQDCSLPVLIEQGNSGVAQFCPEPFGKLVSTQAGGPAECQCSSVYGNTELYCTQCRGVRYWLNEFAMGCKSTVTDADCGFEGRACPFGAHCALVNSNAQCVPIFPAVPNCNGQCVGGQVCRFVNEQPTCVPPEEPTVCNLSCESPLVCQFIGGEKTCVQPVSPPGVCSPGCEQGHECAGPVDGPWSCVPTPPPTEPPICPLNCESPLVCQFVNGEALCAVDVPQLGSCSPGCVEGQECAPGTDAGAPWSCVSVTSPPVEPPVCSLNCESPLVCQFLEGEPICAQP